MTRSDAATDDMEASRQPASGPSSPASGPRSPSELVLRILTAAIMAPVGVFVVLQGSVWLMVATALCAVIAALEWRGMVLASQPANANRWIGAALSLIAICGVLLGANSFALVLIFGLGASLAMLAAGVWQKIRPWELCFGALYMCLPFGAFIHIRENWENGGAVLLFTMVLVWTTDIAAFLAGRGFGGPRIAPQKSPNKTWTGAAGALVCTMLAGAAIARFLGQPALQACLSAGILSVVAQAGDLLESWFKRHFGVKDASGIIPGHGGVLDRLDSLMAVVVFIALLDLAAPGLWRPM